MQIRRHRSFYLAILLTVLPAVADAQNNASKLLIESDKALSQGHFVFEKTSYVPNLFAPPDNLPSGTIRKRVDQRIKSIVELRYSSSQFARHSTDSENQSVIQEYFDGTYFCRLAAPPPSEKGIRTDVVVERKGKMFDRVMYSNARVITIFPGAMLFQGRGVTVMNPNVKLSNATSSFVYNGLKANVTFDPAHGYVAKSLILYNESQHRINEMIMKKPVRLKSGVWIASDTTLKSFDATGNVVGEMRVRFLGEKNSTDLPFAPIIRKGYIVTFMVDDHDVLFQKTSDKPITLPELEALAKKKAPQDARLTQALEDKGLDDARKIRSHQLVRVGSGITALIVACAIVALIRHLATRKPNL